MQKFCDRTSEPRAIFKFGIRNDLRWFTCRCNDSKAIAIGDDLIPRLSDRALRKSK
jgi:hypothetical protein